MDKISIGCSIKSYKRKKAYQKLNPINIENLQYPEYLDKDYWNDLQYLRALNKKIVLDGPYIDLNPGASEISIQKLTYEKVIEAVRYGIVVNADEIVFLSTFLPFIGLKSYEKKWIEKSKKFWRAILIESGGMIRISICNTFEFIPDHLIDIVESIGHRNFGLAMDVGHILIWGKISFLEWYRKTNPYVNTIYLHSNNGKADQHKSILTGKLSGNTELYELLHEIAHSTEKRIFLKYLSHRNILSDIEFLEKSLKK